MKMFTIEPLARLQVNRLGRELAAVRIVLMEDGCIVDIRERPIDHNFHLEIDYLLRDGWLPTI